MHMYGLSIQIGKGLLNTNLENGPFDCGKNRVKISLLFLTSETLDFESEYIFESHEHSQSTPDIMPVLTSF